MRGWTTELQKSLYRNACFCGSANEGFSKVGLASERLFRGDIVQSKIKVMYVITILSISIESSRKLSINLVQSGNKPA